MLKVHEIKKEIQCMYALGSFILHSRLILVLELEGNYGEG